MRWIVRLLAFGVAAVLVLAVAAVLLVGYTSFGARLATDEIADMFSNRDHVITIGNPRGLLTGCLCADMITVTDTRGTVATITDLKVDWSPMALFSRRFHATHASAGLVDIRRKPVKTIPDQADDGDGSPFSLPIEIRVDEIALPDIRLGAALTGQPFALSASGRAHAAGRMIDASIDANRQDVPDAKLSADLNYMPDGNRLDLKALVSEPKGGMIATLLKLPQTPALSLDIRGAGPLSQWSGRLQAALDGQPTVTIEGQHVVSGDGLHHLQVKGGGTVDSIMPLAFRPLFAGQTTIDVSATFSDAGKLDIQTGNIATGSVVLAASGTLDPAGNNSLNANLLGTSGPIDLRLPLEDGEARLLISNVNLALTGPARQATLDASASIDRISAPQGNFEKLELNAHSDRFNLADRSGPVQLHALAGEAAFAEPNLARAIQGPITLAVPLQLSRDNIGFNDTTISSAQINGKVSGAYRLAGKTVTGGFNLFVAPAALPDAIAAKFDTTVAASGQITAQLPDTFNLSNLTLKSGTVEAAGTVLLSDGLLDTTVDGRILDLKKLLANAEGSLDFNARATGPLAALGIDGKLSSVDIRLADRHLTGLKATVAGTAAANAPQGEIKATGQIDGQQIDIASSIVSQDGTISIPSLLAEVGANKIEGRIDLSPAFEPQGTLTFDMPDLGLLAALAGQTMKGDLKGSARISTTEGRTALSLTANGEAIERDTLTIARPNVELGIADLKALAVTGVVKADRIVAGSNVISAPTLAFDQAGPQTNFDLKADYDSAPLLASGKLTSANGRTSIAIDSLSARPQGIPLKLAAPTAISIANGGVALTALKIDAGGGSLTVNGTAGTALDLAVDIDRLPAALAEPFVPDLAAEGAISGTATIKGSPDPAGSLDIRADVHGSTAPLTLRMPKDGNLRLSVAGATLALNGSMQAAKLAATVAIDEVSLPQGTFRKAGLSATSDAFDLAARSGTVAVKAVIGEAAFADANLGKALKAPITLAAPLQITPETIRFDGTTLDSTDVKGSLVGVYAPQNKTLNGNFRLTATPAALPDAAAAKFDTPITLEGRLAGTLPSTFSVTNLRLGSGTVEAGGQASFENETLSAQLSGRVLDLKKAIGNAAGAADFGINASGPLNALSVDGTIRANQVTMAGKRLDRLEAAISGTADPQAPQGTIKATGTIDGQPISINGDIQSKDGKTTVPDFIAEVGPNRLQGKLEFSSSFAPAGSVSFDLPDISLLAALAAQQATGDLKGSADITDDDGKIALKILASGSGIRRDTLSIVRPNIDLTVTDLKALTASGSIRVDEIRAGENRIAGLTAAIDQSGAQTGYDVKATYDGAPLVAAGRIETGNGQMTIQLDRFSAAPRKIPVKLTAPARIAIKDGTTAIDGLKILAGSGSITVNGTAADGLKINVAIKDLPANLANSVMPSLAADGLITGTVAVTGTTAAPVVDFKAAWPDAAVAQTKSAGIGALSINADGRFADKKVNIRTTVSGQNGLSLKGGGEVSIAPGGGLDLSFDGNLPFAVIASQLASSGFVLQGNAAFDVKVGGTGKAPLVTGRITTSNGKFIDVRRNLAINNLAATVTLDGRQAVISNAGGRLASGGAVSANGTIGIAPGSGYPVDITVKLDKATYVDGTLVVATTDGALAIRGPLLANPVLSGSLKLEKASITVPERLPRSLQEINVKHRNAPAAVLRQLREDQPQEPSGKSSTLGLDLTLDAPSQIFVRGRGIDAELGGSIVVKGTAAQPIVSGGFTMRRGRMQILNRRLNFDDNGKISFGGDLTPTLDMAASSASGSTTLTVDVSGLATDPSISLSSSPALPQDEVLAQRIFGQSMSKLSPVQIAQLADAVSQLAGGRSTSLFEGLRSNLGVDDFDVSTDEKGQTSVSVGRYLNDRTYFELQQGGSGGAKAIINLDVGRGVKLRAGAGGNGSGEAGIVYEHEY